MLSLVFFGHSTEFVIPTTHQLQAENRKSHPAVVVLTLTSLSSSNLKVFYLQKILSNTAFTA